MKQNCCVCGSDRIKQVFVKDGIPYYNCLKCSFIFSRPDKNANFENALESYEPAYIEYLSGSPADGKNHAAMLRWTERFHPVRGQKVLDIGAGSGKFVRYLRNNQIEACGIEPAQALYRRFLADEPFFFPVTIEEFSKDPPADKFNIIFARDVIEHVDRPDLFLKCASSVLSPGGKLVVTTPDAGSFTARVLGKRWHHYNKYHFSYFSRKTITAIAGECGFHEIGFLRIPHFNPVGYIFQYLNDFVIGRGRLRIPGRIKGIVIPVNLYDTMCVVFKKS